MITWGFMLLFFLLSIIFEDFFFFFIVKSTVERGTEKIKFYGFL